MSKHILVVDDEQNIREIISDLLMEMGYKAEVAVDGLDALNKIEDRFYDLYIVDIYMPRMGGLDLLVRLKEIQPTAVVIISTGYSSIDLAVKAIRAGAYHYLTKPIQVDELMKVVESGLAQSIELTEEPVTEHKKEEQAAKPRGAAAKTDGYLLLRGFTAEQKQSFLDSGDVRHYPAGLEIPLNEEEGSMIFIEKGSVAVYHNDVLVETLKEGDAWGEETLISSQTCFANLRAQNDVQLRQFRRNKIIEFFSYQDENLTKRYMINLVQCLYIKWRRAILRLGMFSGYTSEKGGN